MTIESNYQKLKDDLEKLKCTNCNGSGKVDDAEPGDISFNECTCTSCRGTGLNDGFGFVGELVFYRQKEKQK